MMVLCLAHRSSGGTEGTVCLQQHECNDTKMMPSNNNTKSYPFPQPLTAEEMLFV